MREGAKKAPSIPPGKEELISDSYLRAGITLQSSAKRACLSTGIPITAPREFGKFERDKAVTKHWAQGTPSWDRLSVEEQERAVANQFTVESRPPNWFNFAPYEVQDHSWQLMEGGRALGTKMTVLECPKVDGLTPSASKKASVTHAAKSLGTDLKRESGKELLARMFLIATAPLQSGFRDYGSDLRASHLAIDSLMPGRGPREKDTAAKRINDFVQIEPDAVLLSLDIKAWSPSQIRRFFHMLHSASASCAGQNPDVWLKLIEFTYYTFNDGLFRDVKKSGGLNAAKRAKIASNVELIKDGTYQGFTVFGDTAAHGAIWKTILRDLEKRRLTRGSGLVLVFMDDLTLGVVSPRPLNSTQDAMTPSEFVRDLRVGWLWSWVRSFSWRLI